MASGSERAAVARPFSRMTRARRIGSLLLALGLVFSSIEVAWARAGAPDDAEPIPALTQGSARPASDGPEAPLRHAGHDDGCSCACAGPCPGAMGVIGPTTATSEASAEADCPTLPAGDRLPLSTAPEPLLRPPLR